MIFSATSSFLQEIFTITSDVIANYSYAQISATVCHSKAESITADDVNNAIISAKKSCSLFQSQDCRKIASKAENKIDDEWKEVSNRKANRKKSRPA
ncbi:hypothetical protein WA026_003090 [Henosepilachna vigintioctopunctata]|uniref:Transcription factor CBF/NF-Y/archaeal histone domain-containing protein n=1 Tax=Henosepilachna vigintioctopunctata TaxID=420089 RepID=A0AAW1TH52_9CUCU